MVRPRSAKPLSTGSNPVAASISCRCGGIGRRARLKIVLSEKERLIQKYNQLEQDIVTYENNIGFFSMSKNSEPLIKQMTERIAQAKLTSQATKKFQVFATGSVHNAACTHKHQHFHDGMVESE